jgi:HlyD family secretion protein
MRRFAFLALLALAGCGQQKAAPWLGYGEGDYVLIAAPEGGWVTSLDIERGQWVHRGELLFTLDSTAQQASREQAEASLQAAQASLAQQQATLRYNRIELARQQGLARARAGTQQLLQQAESNYRQSVAQVRNLEAQIGQMQASLQSADYTLSQRRITSLTEGPVEDIYYRPGEYASAASSVVEVLPPKNVFVRFFVPETDFDRVHLGEKVRITCDSCKPMIGTITFIASQEEYTPPVIFSVNNREKLVFKLEARAPGGLAVHPGEPVEVRPL